MTIRIPGAGSPSTQVDAVVSHQKDLIVKEVFPSGPPGLTGPVGATGAPGPGAAAGGLLRAPQVLTVGTSITHPTGTRLIRVRGVGASGAAGGTTAQAYSVGGASGSGTYAEKTFVASSLTSAYVVGAAGVGVSGTTGGVGTASTFTHGGVTVTCPPGAPGGTLAGGSPTFGSTAFAPGGDGGTPATNADLSISGQIGGYPQRYRNGDTVDPNGGGSTPLGEGAPGALLENANSLASGLQGTGFGAGSRGQFNGTSTTASAGADGLPGVWIVEEYG